MNVHYIVSYAHLASALVNGDTSGLDSGGEEELASFCDYADNFLFEGRGTLEVVGVKDGEEPFFGTPEHGSFLPGDCHTYVAIERPNVQEADDRGYFACLGVQLELAAAGDIPPEAPA